MNAYRIIPVVSVFLLLLISCGLTQLDAQTSAQQTAQSLPNPDQDSNASNETTARAMRTEWRQLFNQGAWTTLEADANQLRNQHLRFNGGIWALRLFYLTVSPAGPLTATDAAWQTQITKLQQWAQQMPQSPTPRIALADAYLRYAWKARGSGFSNTVTPEGWRLFKERVQAAQTALDQAQPIINGDPEWYRAMMTVALAQGWPRTQVDALVDGCLNIEPGYFYVPRSEATYLLPKWHGKPGDTEQFAADVADRIGGKQGDATYFLIAQGINCCGRTQAPGMSWPRVRNGFLALDELYGSNSYQRNVLAYLALKAGDQQTARLTFAVIGDDWARDVWKSKPRFDASRTGQRIGDVLPLQPDSQKAAAGQ
jgi:hypothetical protein